MEKTNKRKLVILSDYGLDDAVALVYLLNNSKKFSSIDIVAIAGNSSKECSFGNAQKLLCQYDGDKSFVRLINSDTAKQYYECLPSVHGEDHMGDLFNDQTHNCEVCDYESYVDTIPQDAIILSLGPCTITLDILKRIGGRDLVIMAGMVDAEPNFREMEFNQVLDVESYQQTLKYPHVIATLDTCRADGFNLAKYKFNSNNLLAILLNRAIDLALARHDDRCFVYDLMAGLYLVMPEIYKAEKVCDKWGNTLTQLRLKDEKFSLGDMMTEFLDKL